MSCDVSEKVTGYDSGSDVQRKLNVRLATCSRIFLCETVIVNSSCTGVTNVFSAKVAVFAAYIAILTSRIGLAGIRGAGIGIIAINRLMPTSCSRGTSVNRTLIVIIAGFWSVLTTYSRIALIIGAGIIIVTINESAGTTNSRVACR
jgi:hypothetical protein